MKKNIISIFAIALLFCGAAFADTYTPDPNHTTVGFCAKHLLISTVCGQFKDYSAEIQFDAKDLTKSSLAGAIKTASITTGNDKRDAHLKSSDFFDVEKYAEITFKSTKIEKQGDGYLMTGSFTMHGVTKDIKMPFTVNGPVNAMGGTRIGISASTTINRMDYGVSWDAKMDTGGLVVSNEIKITIEAEAVKK